MDSVGMHGFNGRTPGNFSKRCPEDGDGRTSTTEECDSTTEPGNPKVHFAVGDDVYYQEDTGQNVLGTVAVVQGKKVKIIFMDETEKWAHVSKLKKLGISLTEDDDSSKQNGALVSNSNDAGVVTSVSKKKTKGESNGQGAPKENQPVTCGSCGTEKTITSRKAMEYSPHTPHQYNCRKCINKSKTSKNNGVPLPLAAHYLAARGRPKGTDNGTNTISKGLLDQGIANGMFRQENNICLHCRTQIVEKVSLQCTMCERPCHPSCLALTPPPLPGDMFWSIICHVCGTQKPDGSLEHDSQKLYSSRRNISSWSDVAYLVLSCLGCRYPHEKFFDLDKQVIPFWQDNLARLHLPRQYKSAEPTERRKLLLLALNNASLRFVSDDASKSLWGLKDSSYKGLGQTLMIKPPTVGGTRAVTAAGFPISVRTSNPEAASVAMTNIAQTIAANKVHNVPTPKNSPSNAPNKIASTPKMSSTATGTSVNPGARKTPRSSDHAPTNVAKKSGTEMNFGAQQRPKFNDIWPQSKYQRTSFLPDLPESAANRSGKEVPAASTKPQQFSNGSGGKMQSVGQQATAKQGPVLSASPGGAARVTGMVMSSNLSPSATTSTQVTQAISSAVSYPVRKNGSPMFNRSIRVEPVERRMETDAQPHNTLKQYRLDEGGSKFQPDLIRESPGFNNTSPPKLTLKRKLTIRTSSDAANNTSFSRNVEVQSTEAKKLKMSLPNSTDVTSQRVPSPTKPPETDLATKGTKKSMSPLQKLSDLQRNGGLTVACLTHTESGVQTVAIKELGEGKSPTGKESSSVLKLSPEKYETMHTTPVKNSNGASAAAKVANVDKPAIPEADDNTKEKSNNVTTSPRAFKLASVSSPGTSKTSPERRMVRPVRLKRTVVANAQSVKQSKDNSDVEKVNANKKVKGNAAAAALVAKASRGRPKKTFKGLQLRKPIGMTYNPGQFNGPVQKETGEEDKSGQDKINESDYSWNSSTINDLVQYGQGYRLGCLPRAPDNKKELEDRAVKYLKEEVTPRPPSYWSSSSSHSKKPTYQKSRKDLKNVDSYYISGRCVGENGIQYQVVWRDGYGFEYSSEDEEELGVGLGNENYLCFEDYDAAEYFFDKMPVTGNNLTSYCDKSSTGSKRRSSDNLDVDEEMEPSTSNNDDLLGVKREPIDSAENSPVKGLTLVSRNTETRARSIEPMIIDLTDSP